MAVKFSKRMYSKSIINKSVLLFLAAEDFNGNEFQIIHAELLKAGIRTFICSDARDLCIGYEGKKVKNDIALENANSKSFGALVIIGGKGILRYSNNNCLLNLAASFIKERKLIGAICLAPVILAGTGLLQNTGITAHPEGINAVTEKGCNYFNKSVVLSDNIITGRDPEASTEFISAFLNRFKTYYKGIL